jgi:hypothetical protein
VLREVPSVDRNLPIGVPRFELGASPTRTERATKLRHTPEPGQSIAYACGQRLGQRVRRNGTTSCTRSPPGRVSERPIAPSAPIAKTVQINETSTGSVEGGASAK